MFKFTSMLFAFLLLAPVSAQAVDIYSTFASYESAPSESLDDFMVRVAPELAKITASSGFEACAVVGQSQDGRFGLTLTTSQSQMACILRPKIIPEGFVAMNMSIHSHPDSTSPRSEMTTMDKQLTKAMGRTPMVKTSSRSNFGKLRRTTNFSTDDFNQGPGYLVTGNRVLFQEGFGTTRRVGRFKL